VYHTLIFRGQLNFPFAFATSGPPAKLRFVKGFLTLFAALVLMHSNLAAEPFFFIQLSDPQFGMFNKDKDFKQDTINFEFAVATVNRLRPAFVIITGDLINKPGDAAQNAEYKRIVGKIDSAIPVYNVVGNHDIENVPTPATIAAYTNLYGPDRYIFRHKDFAGVVLNSTVIHSPQNTTNELAAQERWLKGDLERLKKEARHIVVFQHHPWFLKSANEPDEYFNIPSVRRGTYLDLFHKAGVKFLFSGHYHRNAIARDGDLEAVTTGPVGMPLGDAKSGLRVVIVRDDGIEHRYYHFGEIPNRIDMELRVEKGKK
jgi:predicted MPP superfamily phosphohydrolase